MDLDIDTNQTMLLLNQANIAAMQHFKIQTSTSKL